MEENTNLNLLISEALNESKFWFLLTRKVKSIGIDLDDLDLHVIALESEEAIAREIAQEVEALEYNLNRETLI